MKWFIPLVLLQSAIAIAAPQEGFKFFKDQRLSNSGNESPIEEPAFPQGMKEDVMVGNETPIEEQKVRISIRVP